MISNYIEEIIKLPLFKTFTRDYLKSILNLYNYSIQKFDKGETIFNEGEVCSSIFVILEGEIRIQKIDSSGRYLTIGEAGPGEMIGPNVLFSDNSVYPLSTDAITQVAVLTLSKELVLKLCQINLNFLETLLRVSSGKAFMLTKRLDEVTVQTLKQNISRFLLSEFEKSGDTNILLPFTKKEWADKLGVQRTSLQREIKKMEDLGLIKASRTHISILDTEELTTIAAE
ncbi:MAG: Crp/Fnr family transcriptional regulator [Clostridiaceae bacterium]